MRVLFDGAVRVHYGFLSLEPADRYSAAELMETRAGQSNGLCGAAHPGALSMVTGLHTGPVPVRVELHDTPPAPDDSWEDVVEVSLAPAAEQYGLASFDENHAIGPLPATSLRARWHARGMDTAHQEDTSDGETELDRYLLQLWPAPVAPDVVVAQGSDQAAYWHGEAAATPRVPA